MEGYAEDILGGGARYVQWSTHSISTHHTLFFALFLPSYPPEVSSI